MENEIVTQEKEMVYEVEGGRKVTLSPTLIRKYLVRGKGGPFTTAQEIAFFVGLCRARKMDPWAGDCYIVKYADRDPAAIVTSIDFVRARARSNEDCQGWTCGVIVAGADGKPRDTNGLVLEGDRILGGWASCQPKGWATPMRLEVNLSGYLKKTADGKITKFWQPENQPTMIAKVAEMQLLRRIWPAAAGKMYLAEEVGGPSLGEGMDMEIDMEPQTGSEGGGPGTWSEKTKTGPEETLSEKFERLAKESGISDLESLTAFVRATKKNEAEMQAAACADFQGFSKLYKKALAKKQQRDKERAEIEAKTKAAEKSKTKAAEKAAESQQKTSTGPFPAFPKPQETINENAGEVVFPGPFAVEEQDNRPNKTTIVCSRRSGDEMVLGYCRTNCISKIDCQDWRQ